MKQILVLKGFSYFPLLSWEFKSQINFLTKDILKVLIFSCSFIIVKVKMGYNVWVGTDANRIDKLGEMVWSQLSTKSLQITIFDIDDWDRMQVSIFKRKFIFRIEFIST